MFNISSYLKKFAHLHSSREKEKEVIFKTLKEVVGFEIKENEYRTTKGVLVLHIHPLLKHQTILKKQKILDKIAESGLKGIVNIT